MHLEPSCKKRKQHPVDMGTQWVLHNAMASLTESAKFACAWAYFTLLGTTQVYATMKYPTNPGCAIYLEVTRDHTHVDFAVRLSRVSASVLLLLVMSLIAVVMMPGGG